MKPICAILAFLSICLGNPAFISAQTEGRLAIEVVANAEDSVGERFVFLIKEEVRKSASFRITIIDEPRIKLIVKTMARFPEQAAIATIFSIVWTYEDPTTYPIYWDSTIGFAGATVVESSAQQVLARTDRLVSDLLSARQPVAPTNE